MTLACILQRCRILKSSRIVLCVGTVSYNIPILAFCASQISTFSLIPQDIIIGDFRMSNPPQMYDVLLRTCTFSSVRLCARGRFRLAYATLVSGCSNVSTSAFLSQNSWLNCLGSIGFFPVMFFKIQFIRTHPSRIILRFN